MFVYLSLFYLPLSLKFFSNFKNINFLKFLIMFTLFLIIGLRHQIGGDFFSYANIGRFGAYYRSMDDTLLSLIYLFSYEYLHLGIYGVQLICALILIISLNKFLITLKDYEIGLIIFIPVGIIIGAMGYISQTLALSFGLLAITQINKKNYYNYFIFIILSILSHISGAFFLIFFLVYFNLNKKNLISVFLLCILSIIILYVINMERINLTLYLYIGPGMHLQSLGALPRFFFSLISAFIFLLYIRKKINNSNERKVYTIYSYLTILLLPLIFIASTFADRINLYFVPFQAYVFTTYVYLLNNSSLKKLMNSLIIFFYGMTMIIWLLVGSHSHHWIPYRIFPLQYCISLNFNEYNCEYFSYNRNINFEARGFDLDTPR